MNTLTAILGVLGIAIGAQVIVLLCFLVFYLGTLISKEKGMKS